jgi:LPXTG-motif cell wall-anchored protein
MDGGVVLQLAHSEAEVAGAPAVATPQSQVLAAQTTLPRTGGTPWVPIAGIGMLAIALVGRRALAVRTVRD